MRAHYEVFFKNSVLHSPSEELKTQIPIPYIGSLSDMPKKLAELPRQTVWMDDRGRMTIPEYLREAMGLKKGAGSFVEVSAEPNLDNCKGLLLRKSY